MSFLAKLFGGGESGSKKAPTPGEAIQRLRDVEEMLIKKSDFLELKVKQELEIAKKNGTKNKRAALQALKRKKRYEKQLGQIDGTLTTIELQREALENASTNNEVLKIMGYAAKALKNAHKMDVDEAIELMDDIHEQTQLANEIVDVISDPFRFNTDIDEDELDAELEELMQKELNDEIIAVGPRTNKLPDVPSVEPARSGKAKQPVEEEEDEDWKALAAFAS